MADQVGGLLPTAKGRDDGVAAQEELTGCRRSPNTPHPFPGPNPHLDHIHFSFSWAGAMKRTSWWTGQVAPEEYGPCWDGTDQPAPPYGNTVNLTPCPVPEGAVHALRHAQPAEDSSMPQEHRR